MAAPASGVGVQLCPSAPGGGTVTPCAATAAPVGLTGPPSAFAAVPGMSDHQQHQETSRSSRRRRLSSSDGTDRASKKRPRGRSPSPGPSSCRRERPYRLSSKSSEDARAVAAPPRAGSAPGGTPGDFRPAPAGDRSPHPGPSGWTSLSSARAELVVDPHLLWVWRMTTGLAPSTRLTLTGMTLSGQSWPSFGTSTPWKSLQVSHQLDARPLLHRSMG